MDYKDKILAKRTQAKVEHDKNALIDTFIKRLGDSGILPDTKDEKALATALTQLVDKLEEVKPKDDTALLEAIKELANKEMTVNYTPPKVVVPEISVPNITLPEIVVPEIKAPEVKVPKITVPKVDTSGIEQAIRESMVKDESEPLELENYMAHDIKEKAGKQYIGFVAPDGSWYIIENLIQENKMRYLFGTEGYSDVFENASTYQYKILSEAVNEI